MEVSAATPSGCGGGGAEEVEWVCGCAGVAAVAAAPSPAAASTAATPAAGPAAAPAASPAGCAGCGCAGGGGGTRTAASWGYSASKPKAGTPCAAHTRHKRSTSVDLRRSVGRGCVVTQHTTRWPWTRGSTPVCVCVCMCVHVIV